MERRVPCAADIPVTVVRLLLCAPSSIPRCRVCTLAARQAAGDIGVHSDPMQSHCCSSRHAMTFTLESVSSPGLRNVFVNQYPEYDSVACHMTLGVGPGGSSWVETRKRGSQPAGENGALNLSEGRGTGAAKCGAFEGPGNTVTATRLLDPRAPGGRASRGALSGMPVCGRLAEIDDRRS